MRRQRVKEFEENVKVEATGEPHVLRELTNEEKQILLEKHKIAYKFVNAKPVIIPFFVLIIIVLLYQTLELHFSTKSKFWDLAAIISFFFYMVFSEGDLYKDLRSGVFGLRGKLIKRLAGFNKKEEKHFVVRGIWFSSNRNTQVDEHWDDFKEGDMVEIEYSPFSKYIWRIKKV